MNKQLKIGFADMSVTKSVFVPWIESRGHVIAESDLDILIHGDSGVDHLHIPAKKMISYTGECCYPNLDINDFSISHMRASVGGRNLYWPYYYKDLDLSVSLPEITREDAKRRFAIFIASQESCGEGARLRKAFVNYVMSHYRQVDCPGRVLHNVDIPELGESYCEGWLNLKRQVISRYKFLFSFENSNADGYITEKMVDAFVSHAVPIYWGSEGNIAPFPKEAMICANDYPDFESLLARIREVDENDELYLRMLAANPLRYPEFKAIMQQKKAELYDFLDQIAARAQGEFDYGLNPPSRGFFFRDPVSYVSCLLEERDKRIAALETKLHTRSGFMKFLIKLIPITSWRRRIRKKYKGR